VSQVCPQCGRPVEVAGDPLDQFESPEDAETAEPPLHPACVRAYALRPDRPRARVYYYDSPDGGPLAGAG
jgi:hypothetical protein